VENKVYAQET